MPQVRQANDKPSPKPCSRYYPGPLRVEKKRASTTARPELRRPHQSVQYLSVSAIPRQSAQTPSVGADPLNQCGTPQSVRNPHYRQRPPQSVRYPPQSVRYPLSRLRLPQSVRYSLLGAIPLRRCGTPSVGSIPLRRRGLPQSVRNPSLGAAVPFCRLSTTSVSAEATPQSETGAPHSVINQWRLRTKPSH